jgi:hypothetical protein
MVFIRKTHPSYQEGYDQEEDESYDYSAQEEESEFSAQAENEPSSQEAGE